MEMQSRWIDHYPVGWHDADAKGVLSPVALCKFLMETAGRHAEHLRFGYNEAIQREEIWVVVQLVVKMRSYPAFGSDFIVETWPMGVEGLYAFREFFILDEIRNQLGAASSKWMVIDRKTRRPQSMEIVKNTLHLIIPEPALVERPGKIPSPADPEMRKIHQVAYSEIDYSGHVNNARYIEWALNSIPMEWHIDHHLMRFQVNYLSEVRFGETINIVHDRLYNLFEGIREGDRKSVFKVMLEWETK